MFALVTDSNGQVEGTLSAPLVKISELQHALVAHFPSSPGDTQHLIVEFSQEQFLLWQQTPLGLMFSLDEIGRTMQHGPVFPSETKFHLQRFLYQALHALRVQCKEVDAWITALE